MFTIMLVNKNVIIKPHFYYVWFSGNSEICKRYQRAVTMLITIVSVTFEINL